VSVKLVLFANRVPTVRVIFKFGLGIVAFGVTGRLEETTRLRLKSRPPVPLKRSLLFNQGNFGRNTHMLEGCDIWLGRHP